MAYGTNLYLRGEGVGQLNIVERSYNLSSSHLRLSRIRLVRLILRRQAFAHDCDRADDVTAGRTFTLSIGAVGTGVIMTAAAQTFSPHGDIH